MRPVRFGLLVVTLLVVQTSLVSQLVVFGARGDIVLLLAVASGLLAGPERGAIAGFSAGLAFDLLLQSPLGLSALIYCMVGYLVGIVHSAVLRSAWWIPVASAVGASVVGVVAFAVVGEVLGQDDFLNAELPVIALVVAFLNGLLVLPVLRAVRWAVATEPSASPVGFAR